MATDDHTLLTRWAQHGDAEAFRDLVQRHSGMVYGVCRRILGNPSDAEDAAQACFEALASVGEKPGAYLAAWLHRVATYHALNVRRKESRLKQREAEALRRETAHSEATWDDLYALVDEAINALPEPQRAMLVAHYLEQQPQGEIALVHGVSRPRVNQQIARAIARVRGKLAQRGIRTASGGLAALLTAHAAEAAPANLTARLARIAVLGPQTAAPLAARVAVEQALAASVVSVKVPVFAGLLTLLVVIVGVYIALRTNALPASTPNVKEAQEATVAKVSPAVPESMLATAPPAATTPPPAPNPDRASIRGFLRTPNGAGLPDHAIRAMPLGVENPHETSKKTWTDTQGAFVLDDLVPGRYFVYTTAAAIGPRIVGKSPESRRTFNVDSQSTVITIAAGEAKTGVVLIFDEGLQITGRVVDEAGKPLAGVHVRGELDSPVASAHPHSLAAEVPSTGLKPFGFDNGFFIEDTTNAEGQFRLVTLTESNYRVQIEAKGYRPQYSEHRAGTEGLEVVLQKPGKYTVSGRVVDMDTQHPLVDFEVGIVPVANSIWGGLDMGTVRQKVHHTNGEFHLEAEDPDRHHLWAQADGHFRNLQQLSTQARSDSTAIDGVVLALPKARTVRGRVVDADDKPIREALLYLGAPINLSTYVPGEEHFAKTTADGTFEVAVPDRKFILSAGVNRDFMDDAEGKVGDSVEVPAGTDSIDDIVLRISKKGATLRGTIRYLGQPIATNFNIGASEWMGRFWGGESDVEGKYAVTELPPLAQGELSVSQGIAVGFGPYHPAGSVPYKSVRMSRNFAIAREGDVASDIDFVGGAAQLRGRVIIDDEPIADVLTSFLLKLEDGTEQTYFFAVDDDAAFIAGGLPPGSGTFIVFFVEGIQYYRWEMPFALSAGQSLELDCNVNRDSALPASNNSLHHPYMD